VQPSNRGTFKSRFGFYMAAIGSAFGLGNLWRFSYVTGINGGGAFVLLYIFFVGAIGLPVLISELMLGKITRRNIIGAFKWKPWGQNPKSRWRWLGVLALLASFVVLGYYTVVSGWVIHFIVQAVMGQFTNPDAMPEYIIDRLMSRGYLQILLAGVHIIFTASIVSRGIQEGIERFSRVFMPLFMLIVVGLVVHSLFLPGASEALRFLFYPDFSKLSASAAIEALGHALFTLSLGFGAMVAYGSYLKPEVHIPSEAVLVAGLDTILSLCAGVLIFPIVFTMHADSGSGPALLFKSMPVLFRHLPLGYWVGVAFFVCLYFAALSASIALFEGLVTYFIDEQKMKRTAATLTVSTITCILAAGSALSGSLFKNIRLGERGILEIMDQVIINWTLPVVTVGLVLFVSRMREKDKEDQFVDQKSLVSVRMFSTWKTTIKYLVPSIIILVFIFQLIVNIFRS